MSTYARRLRTEGMMRLLALCLFSILCMSCQQDRPRVELFLTGLTADVTDVAVTLQSGPRKWTPQSLGARSPKLILELPAELQGSVDITVDGVAGDGCALLSGSGRAEVTGPGSYTAFVTLTRLTDRPCLVEVTKLGEGGGIVTSVPAGIDCGPACRVVFGPYRTPEITLHAAPDPESIFVGWSGAAPDACPGTGDCILKTRSTPTTVRPIFRPKRICRKDGWCWENPLPHGIIISGLWGSDDRHVWAVGAAGLLQFWNGSVWVPFASGTEVWLNDVWGSGPDDVWAVGGNGTILHWDGMGWTLKQSGTAQSLRGVWGSGPRDVWAVGGTGTILHWDGVSWQPLVSGTANGLQSVWGTGPGDVWFVGLASTILHWDGRRLSPGPVINAGNILRVRSSPDGTLWLVTGDQIWRMRDGAPVQLSSALKLCEAIWPRQADDVWIGCEKGIMRWDGKSLSLRQASRAIGAVWGQNLNSVWAGGAGGLLQHWNGAYWTDAVSGSLSTLYGVWGPSANQVFAVGEGATWLARIAGAWLNWSQLSETVYHQVWGTGADDYWIVGNSGVATRIRTMLPAQTYLLDSSKNLLSIWGSSASDIWMSATGGGLYHWQGSSWTPVTSNTTEHLTSIWGLGPKDIWAVGYNGTILHYDGASWLPAPKLTSAILMSVHGSVPNEVWAVASSPPSLLRWNGSSWRSIQIPGLDPLNYLVAVWVGSPTDVWVMGSVVAHFDGAAWSVSPAGTLFNGIWGSRQPGEPRHLWAVGAGGSILHRTDP